jgi:periplasmic protein CpxP/Spy
MKRTSKILTGLVLTGLLSTSVYANCGIDKKQNGEINYKGHHKEHMMKGSSKMKKVMPIFKVIKDLNLSKEQRAEVKKIIINSKKNHKSMNTLFTKDSFNKVEFIKRMNEKRENMIKSRAETIEKIYTVLDKKQKEQFKVLIDLEFSKMGKRFN